MTHIEMSEEYTQGAFYSGTLNRKYHFYVVVTYSNFDEVYKIGEIRWTGAKVRPDSQPNKKLKQEAEPKIKEIVLKWFRKEESE
mgnify:CR=1 FL=1